jgi:hypothetical protein
LALLLQCQAKWTISYNRSPDLGDDMLDSIEDFEEMLGLLDLRQPTDENKVNGPRMETVYLRAARHHASRDDLNFLIDTMAVKKRAGLPPSHDNYIKLTNDLQGQPFNQG